MRKKMMNEEIIFDNEEICDVCGKQGAFDFMGDCLCPECSDTIAMRDIKNSKPDIPRS
ncbi:MAG: hypothetical protein U9P90_01515 [Patescibacteria group bacterium]|nr:hypothetical protein [Patescibacteria group bacterium]